MRATILLLLVSLNVVAAPLTVQVRSAKDTFLVYEAIPVTVSIHNYSSRSLQLEESNQESWLDFVVLDENNSIVHALGHPVFGQPVLIPPGETVSQTIDVLPLYELRERGAYRIQAVVKSPLGNVESAPLRVWLTNGRELWTQEVGLPTAEGTPEQFRTYTLLAYRGPHDDSLFVGVRDDARQVVYSLVSLGSFLSTVAPQPRADRAGNLHVLYQNGPRSFGYVKVDPSAKALERAAYSDFASSPTLTVNDGEVSVTGGEQTYPKTERIMTDEELNPPPPPAPKPKRHWWWPFGPRA
jgi:hypothetical protein